MSIKSGFFNSVNGDREYNADQLSTYFKGLVSANGVYENYTGAFQVLAGTGLTVNVQPGRALINYKWVESDAVESLTINTPHVTLNRYTAIVLQLDISNRDISLITVDGTNATNPVKPAIVNTSTIKQICLAYVYVGAGVTSISQSKITDMRPSSSCGWITGLINQVDTSSLFNQWQTAYEEFYGTMESWLTSAENQFTAWQQTQQAAYNAWFEALTEQLNVNTYVEAYTKNGTGNNISAIHLSNLTPTGYEYEASDTIILTVNGLVCTPNTEYTIDTSDTVPVINMAAAFSGDYFVMILKSKIGYQQ